MTVQFRFQRGHRAFRVVGFERFAMLALLSLETGKPLALHRPRKHHRWPVARLRRGLIRSKQCVYIMAIDNKRLPTKRFPSRPVHVHLVLQHRWLALAQSVDVDRSAQTTESIPRTELGRFPHRSFRALAVTHQHVRSAINTQEPRVERQTDAGGEALAK